MVAKAVPVRVERAASDAGTSLAAWRRMQNLTAVQVAERADISRDTLRRLEHGDPGVSFGTVLAVARALGSTAWSTLWIPSRPTSDGPAPPPLCRSGCGID